MPSASVIFFEEPSAKTWTHSRAPFKRGAPEGFIDGSEDLLEATELFLAVIAFSKVNKIKSFDEIKKIFPRNKAEIFSSDYMKKEQHTNILFKKLSLCLEKGLKNLFRI